MNDPFSEFIHRHAPHLIAKIEKDTPLIDGGLLDSLLLMSFIAFLDYRYGLVVPDEEIVPQNFHDCASIGRLIARLELQAQARSDE